jgi:hypothetical protein
MPNVASLPVSDPYSPTTISDGAEAFGLQDVKASAPSIIRTYRWALCIIVIPLKRETLQGIPETGNMEHTPDRAKCSDPN